MASIHIGEKIRQRAKELRIGPTELAKLINTSKQNLYGIFKRKSLDTELLNKISGVLNYNFFRYYIDIEKILLEALMPQGKETKQSPLETIVELKEELRLTKKELDDLK